MMKATLYFIEGILQIILGALNIAHGIRFSEKLGKVMNIISGTGFVVLGVLNCVLGCSKMKEQHLDCSADIELE